MKKRIISIDWFLLQDIKNVMQFVNDRADNDPDKDAPFALKRYDSVDDFIEFLLRYAIDDLYIITRDYDSQSDIIQYKSSY